MTESNVRQRRNIGSSNYEWSSVFYDKVSGRYLTMDIVDVYPSLNVARSSGFPLRCLVNSTVGE